MKFSYRYISKINQREDLMQYIGNFLYELDWFKFLLIYFSLIIIT